MPRTVRLQPQGLAILLALACACSLASANQTNRSSSRVRIECAQLSRALQSLLAIETTLSLDEHPEACMSSSLVQLFLRESSALLSVAHTDGAGLELTLPDRDPRFTEALVLALIGRHYTAHFGDSQTHFSFNTATHTLIAKLPQCEHQKSFFITLLFSSIALLIFSMVAQRLNAIEHETARACPSHTPPGAALIRSTAPAHVSIDFGPRRSTFSRGHAGYVAVPT